MKKNNSKKSDSSPSSRFIEGQKLAGCYGLTRRLDAGDGPEIWLAVDDVLGKEVSLHFIPTALIGDTEAMNGLRQEVKRTRQLIHPNILRVYDIVEEADWAAVSMDAFDGESLAVKLSQTRSAGLQPSEIQPWLSQLFQTLDDAHKINVMHRDLAPADVLLCQDGKLLVKNFGISRLLADSVARISGKADARLAARSPQQITGAPATRQDDIYAVGTLLFEALTGRLPFSGKDLAAQIQNTAPQTIALGSSEVPESWKKTIAACLEKNPEARPQTATEIGGRLSATVALDAVPEPLHEEPVAAVVIEPKVFAEPVAVVAEKSSETRTTSDSSEAAKQSESPVTLVEKKSGSVGSPSGSAKKTRFPFLGSTVAAGLIVIGLAGYHFSSGGNKQTPIFDPVVAQAPAEPAEESDLRPASNKLEGTPLLAEPTAAEPAALAPVVDAAPVAVPVVEEPQLLASAAPVVAVIAPVAAPAAARPAPIAAAPAGDEEKIVAEKAAALEAAKQAAQEAEKTHADMARKQQQAAAAVAEAEKALALKNKAVGPVKKAADEVLAQRKKLEDDQKAADLAAEQARQLAAEKARSAEAAKKAIAELEAKNKEKLSAQEKADAEIMTLQKSLADRQESGASVAKEAAAVEASRARFLATIKQSEQELNQAKLAAAEARRLREEAEAERRKLGQELAEMQKMMDKKRAEIEERLKKLEKGDAKPPLVVPVPEPVKPPEPRAVETPTPAPKPVGVLPNPVAPPVATPVPVAPPAEVAVVKPTPATPPPTQLVMKTDPDKNLPVPPPKPLGAENSLGLKFVPVGDVEFCVWQTRVKDFDTFAKAVNLKSSAWKSPGFKQGPDHPVVNVSWVEAVAFCKWLTEEERKTGGLTANQYYRLPTDAEWSKAVGLPEESGKTPEARDMGVSDVYPWGNQWPPPAKAGNYTGEETGSDVAIKGFDDGFPWTSPVGSFTPNKLGLYDMGGNVWQWCMDTWNADSKAKVLRGASWYNGALKLSLLSSCRVRASPESSTDNYGFRVVRAAGKK